MAVLCLAGANLLVFLALAVASGTTSPPPGVLAKAGALTSATLQTGQCWRVFSAGFLHASPLHLFGNLQMLLVCGPLLERRLGRTGFLLVYASAMAGGGLLSLHVHHGPFVGVGASGAIFGLLGALAAFWITGNAVVPARFLVANLGLNAAISALVPEIDWAAHLGGFTAGMICVALFGIWARVAPLVLRCRFPEFVAANTLLLLSAGALDQWHHPVRVLGFAPAAVGVASWAAGATALVKLTDVLLASRHGLAAVVCVLGLCNGLAAAVAVALLPGTWRHEALPAAGLAVLMTLVLYFRPLVRGIRDVGFVPASLTGGRRGPGGP